MIDETEASSFDSRDLAHNGERPDPPAEVALVLAAALLLLIDLVFGAQRGNLRLHLALEVGAALFTLLAAGHAWLRRARRVARPRKSAPQPASAGNAYGPIDTRLWGAIEAALLEEVESLSLDTKPVRLPPAPPV
jgi:hypothetical protein